MSKKRRMGSDGLLSFPSPGGRGTRIGTCAVSPELRQAPRRTTAGYALSTRRFHPVRVAAHGTADLWVRLRVVCHPDPTSAGSYVSLGSVPLVYHYLAKFERTEDVGWPFAVTFKC
jgi:hypothetical protein